MKILFKQDKNKVTNTLNTIFIDDNVFNLSDKEVVILLDQINNQRPDLFNESSNMERLLRECQENDAYIEELEEYLKNLKEELDEFEDKD